MIEGLLFVAGQAALGVFGLPVVRLGALRRANLGARLAAAYATGAVALTVEAILLSLLGIPCTVLTLGLPLAGGALALCVGRRADATESPASSRPGVLPSLIAGAGLAHFALGCATGLALATDLYYFWGAKALAIAEAGRLDPGALAARFAIHTHVTYPPLFTASLGWSTLVAGGLPWRVVPLTSLLWAAATVALVGHALRAHLGARRAAPRTAFWAVALGVALVASGSAGNAEPVLLLFTTAALALLLGERRDVPAGARPLVAICLAGAVLSKAEGVVVVALALAGTVLRDLLWRRPRAVRDGLALAAAPLGGFMLWLGFRLLRGLPLTDPIRERVFAISFEHLGTIAGAGLANLGGGSRGLVWLAPLAILVVTVRRGPLRILPALAVAGGMFAFLFVYYLHVPTDPARLIGWTLPRVSLSALSALILAAAVTSGVARH